MSRMHSEEIHIAPVWDDITTLQSSELPFEPDVIYGGFPCQDISTAGHGVGLGGERSGLYWELHRLVKEIAPPWVFLENVPAIRTKGLLSVVRSLTDIGYDCRWTRVSAAEVGAPHLRQRWFLLGHANNQGESNVSIDAEVAELSQLANPTSEGLERWEKPQAAWETFGQCRGEGYERGLRGLPEPTIYGDADGLPSRVDRIKGLGNAVVPVQARTAFERLMGLV